MPEQLTNQERRVYQFLIDYLAENTFQPSIREIAKRFRIKSTKTVADLLQSLERKGYIHREQSRSRGVRIVGYTGGGRVQPLPVFGPAGAGGEAVLPEHHDGYITMDRRFVPSPDAYFLRVKGDSMIGRAIVDGDYVMVNPSQHAAEGDVVAARIGDEVQIKTFLRRGSHIVLEPANPAERPIEVAPGESFQLLGVVCGVFRPFCEMAVEGEPLPPPPTPANPPATVAS